MLLGGIGSHSKRRVKSCIKEPTGSRATILSLALGRCCWISFERLSTNSWGRVTSVCSRQPKSMNRWATGERVYLGLKILWMASEVYASLLLHSGETSRQKAANLLFRSWGVSRLGILSTWPSCVAVGKKLKFVLHRACSFLHIPLLHCRRLQLYTPISRHQSQFPGHLETSLQEVRYGRTKKRTLLHLKSMFLSKGPHGHNGQRKQTLDKLQSNIHTQTQKHIFVYFIYQLGFYQLDLLTKTKTKNQNKNNNNNGT